MKHAVLLVCVLSFAIIASGCDLLNMPSKMDETNATTSSMNAKMSETNDQVARTNDQMSRTNHKIDLQTLLVSLSEMYKDNNTRMLVPVPFDMFPGGKTFAEESNESDLVDLFYVKYKRLVESTPDENKRVAIPLLVPKFDENGNKVFEAQYAIETHGNQQYAVPKIDWEYPKEYIDSYNRDLDIVFSLMQVVAGFIPQEMIENVVVKQIGRSALSKDGKNDSEGGLRESTAYMILNFRDVFTRGALLKASLYEDKLRNLDQVKEAMGKVENLDYIAKLPYADKIASTQIKGYLNISENYVYAMQAKANELAVIQTIKLSPSFIPVRVAFDPMAAINNPNQGYYQMNDDGLTVTAIDQSRTKTDAVKYHSEFIENDWNDLKKHFMRDLPPGDQLRGEAPAVLAKIKSHIH